MLTRTWEVGEWWCNSTNIKKWVQIIEISDKEAPKIERIKDITISTGSTSCTGEVLLPPAVITDNCNTWTVEIRTGNGVISGNGGIATLGTGVHKIIYTVTDLCGNQSTKEMQVTVVDKAEPVSVCETRTVVSLKEDGTAWIDAISVDDGSFDECGSVTLKIRRMATSCDTTSTKFGDQVGFCCTDAGKEVMVSLLVTDQGGLTNQCMVTVEVQDKRIPTLTCPSDMTVNCSTTYDPLNLNQAFGNGILTGGGCANNENVTQTISGELNQCRIGTLTRTLTLRYNNAIQGTCNQLIKFEPEQAFVESMIKWPRDTTFTNSMCGPLDLIPTVLPRGYGEPELIEGVCDQIGFTYEDEVYTVGTNSSCYKVIRKWKVINWCNRLPNGTLWQASRSQIIVIMNTKGPEILSSTNKVEVCSKRSDCAPERIELKARAKDDCTAESELTWKWTIIFEDGTKQTGIGNDASGVYRYGIHRIDFEVSDRCGNVNYTGYAFEVKNCKSPLAYCKSGLSTSLIPMDTNGDGTADTEMSVVRPKMFDNGSQQECGNGIRLSFSSNVNDTIKNLTCIDKNRRVGIELWVTDNLGNTAYCTTFIDVRDSNNVNICPNQLAEANIEGRVETETGNPVEEVRVKLERSEVKYDNTTETGIYEFGMLPIYREYKVIPKKYDGTLNGVSTLDLIHIQRHILGVKRIESPYKRIAADINRDGKISASDLVSLRRLILGLQDSMLYKETWRFIWKEYQFSDPTNPWTQTLMEAYEIGELQSDMKIDWIGIKLGDVNGDVVSNGTEEQIETRGERGLLLEYEDREVRKGEEIEMSIKTREGVEISGIEYNIKGGKVKGIESTFDTEIREIEKGEEKGEGEESSVIMTRGNGEIYDENKELMRIKIEVERSGKLSEIIGLTKGRMANVAYIGNDLEKVEIELRGVEGEGRKFEIGQNIPNPWNEITVIPIKIPQTDALTLTIKDVAGRVVMNRSMILQKGSHNIEIGKEMFKSGSYIYEVEYQGEKQSYKMIIIE
ncbi:MAG: hypothetical protein RLZZ546_496 [Bacteroidota bacterium]